MSNSTPIQIPLPIEGATVLIPLSKGYSTIVDAIDADLLNVRWFITGDRRYAHRKIQCNYKRIGMFLHRVILERILNRPLVKGEYVDHIDNDGLNNSRINIRLATQSQNMANSRTQSKSKSGYKGVVWNKSHNCWRVQIKVLKKTYFIGYFHDINLAHVAYAEAARKYFGEFARP